MNKERLEEIKDSIILQGIACKNNVGAFELIKEEKELYDEVLKLNSDWNQLKTYLKNEIKRLQSVEQTSTIILITGKLTDVLDEMSEIKNI